VSSFFVSRDYIIIAYKLPTTGVTVKWKGYGTAEASWEPARAVDAPQILEAYKLRQQDQEAVQDDSDSDEQDSVD